MNRTVSGNTKPGTVDELTALYRETIVRHAVNPVGFGADIGPTHSRELFNPLCGDRIEIQLRVEGAEIEALAFTGEACAICMASASLLCEHLAGHSIAKLIEAHDWLENALMAKSEESGHEALVPLLGVRAYPSRVKCAMLPWDAAADALAEI